MATKAASKRLQKEYLIMQKSAPPFVWAVPDEKNILTWNFIIRGPPDSPYHGGEYHGMIMFPAEYPFKPPGIKMLTPSGRFHPDKKICFSMSDFHPGTWNPAWSVATICTGILSFMLSDEITTGSVTSTDQDKKVLAARSHAWNLKQRRFVEAFPDFCEETMRDLPNMGEGDRGSGSTSAAPLPSATATPTTLPLSATATPSPGLVKPKPLVKSAKAVVAVPPPPQLGWWERWTQAFWNRWPYAALVAAAVVVSRMSS
ncbi:Ubiquitin-conjugating enzyme E2 6 [Tulasnella sp. JGI-2019a]|nr:Ubiquitin-conjugating enzyme E2 6 [Tulasnella sp. JGI-2019a]KAG9025643.1 Ubiquitin-conjugating enzyme E2 6 [Tulasnella sp. JGI-2019a]